MWLLLWLLQSEYRWLHEVRKSLLVEESGTFRLAVLGVCSQAEGFPFHRRTISNKSLLCKGKLLSDVTVNPSITFEHTAR